MLNLYANCLKNRINEDEPSLSAIREDKDFTSCNAKDGLNKSKPGMLLA
jgi:hypothetical protein